MLRMHDHDTHGERHAAIYTKRAQMQDSRRREGYKQKVSFNEPRSKSLKMWRIKWHPKGKNTKVTQGGKPQRTNQEHWEHKRNREQEEAQEHRRRENEN